jgi:hypothetical protein
LGDDLNPVAVRIIDKVDNHILILITDAAHFFMQGMGACEIVDFESKMEFIITQIIKLLSISEPGQFELMKSLTVTEKDDNETAVRRFMPSHFDQLQRFSVEGNAFFQMENIDAIMGESELHKIAASNFHFLSVVYKTSFIAQWAFRAS